MLSMKNKSGCILLTWDKFRTLNCMDAHRYLVKLLTGKTLLLNTMSRHGWQAPTLLRLINTLDLFIVINISNVRRQENYCTICSEYWKQMFQYSSEPRRWKGGVERDRLSSGRVIVASTVRLEESLCILFRKQKKNLKMSCLTYLPFFHPFRRKIMNPDYDLVY